MIDLVEAQERVEPIRDLLVELYVVSTEKWQELVNDKPGLALPLGPTERANFIHAHLRHEVTQRFPEGGQVVPTEALDFFGLRWQDGSILLRLKYLRDGLPSNVKTGRQQELARQEFTPEAMLALAGDPSLTPPTLLTCGYTLLDGMKLGTI